MIEHESHSVYYSSRIYTCLCFWSLTHVYRHRLMPVYMYIHRYIRLLQLQVLPLLYMHILMPCCYFGYEQSVFDTQHTYLCLCIYESDSTFAAHAYKLMYICVWESQEFCHFYMYKPMPCCHFGYTCSVVIFAPQHTYPYVYIHESDS